jgi:hypothetical protein
MKEIHDNKDWDLNWECSFPRGFRYKRRSDIKEVDISEFRVYFIIFALKPTIDALLYTQPTAQIDRWIYTSWKQQ